MNERLDAIKDENSKVLRTIAGQRETLVRIRKVGLGMAALGGAIVSSFAVFGAVVGAAVGAVAYKQASDSPASNEQTRSIEADPEESQKLDP